MPEVLQRALDPPVAPRRILSRHPHCQLADLGEDAGPSDAASGRRPFPRDELAVPSQNRLGGDKRRYLRQHRSPEHVAPTRQPAALRVGQLQPASSDLRFENAILLSQILNYVELVAIDPTCQSHQQNPPANAVDHLPSLYVTDRPAAYSDLGGVFG